MAWKQCFSCTLCPDCDGLHGAERSSDPCSNQYTRSICNNDFHAQRLTSRRSRSGTITIPGSREDLASERSSSKSLFMACLSRMTFSMHDTAALLSSSSFWIFLIAHAWRSSACCSRAEILIVTSRTVSSACRGPNSPRNRGEALRSQVLTWKPGAQTPVLCGARSPVHCKVLSPHTFLHEVANLLKSPNGSLNFVVHIAELCFDCSVMLISRSSGITSLANC